MKRTLITSSSQLDPDPFREIGYDPIRASTIRIEPDHAEIGRLGRGLLEGEFDLALFMSPRSIGLISPDHKLVDSISSMRIYALGTSTRRSLEMRGMPVTGTPNKYAERALAELIAVAHSKSHLKRLALIRSPLPCTSLADWLRSKHLTVKEFRICRSVADPDGMWTFMDAVSMEINAAVFMSRSLSIMLEYLRSHGMDSQLISALKKLRVMVLGPETATGSISTWIEPEVLPVRSINGLS